MLVSFFSERRSRTRDRLLTLSAFLPNTHTAGTIWLSSFSLCWIFSQPFVSLTPSPQICSVESPIVKNVSFFWECPKNPLLKEILSTATQPSRDGCWGPCACKGHSQPPPPELCVFAQVQYALFQDLYRNRYPPVKQLYLPPKKNTAWPETDCLPIRLYPWKAKWVNAKSAL